MSNISISSSSVDVASDDLLHDNANTPKRNVFSGPGDDYVSPFNQKAIDLMLIGIFLLLVVIVSCCCIHAFFVCKSRKQKRLVLPSPEEITTTAMVTEIMTTAIVNGETGNVENSSL
jgi:hypothetical protein